MRVGTVHLSEHAQAVFAARWDGTMATARALSTELGQPLASVLDYARANRIPNAIQPHGGMNELQVARFRAAHPIERAEVIVEAENERGDGEGRRCLRCGAVKPLDAFPRHSLAPGGHKKTCKACVTVVLTRPKAVARFTPHAAVVPHALPVLPRPAATAAAAPESIPETLMVRHPQRPLTLLHSLIDALPEERLWTQNERDAWAKAFGAVLDYLVRTDAA